MIENATAIRTFTTCNPAKINRKFSIALHHPSYHKQLIPLPCCLLKLKIIKHIF